MLLLTSNLIGLLHLFLWKMVKCMLIDLMNVVNYDRVTLIIQVTVVQFVRSSLVPIELNRHYYYVI